MRPVCLPPCRYVALHDASSVAIVLQRSRCPLLSFFCLDVAQHISLLHALLCGLTDIPQLATAWGECHVRRFDDFSGFCATYVAAIECIRTIADLDRLVLEVAEDAAESGATWIEPAGEWHRIVQCRRVHLTVTSLLLGDRVMGPVTCGQWVPCVLCTRWGGFFDRAGPDCYTHHVANGSSERLAPPSPIRV